MINIHKYKYIYIERNAVLQVNRFKSQTFMQFLNIAATFRKHMIKKDQNIN